MPGKIEKRQSGTRTPLCLHRDALDEFARLSELEKRVPQKTSEWLTAQELTQYFPHKYKVIEKKLVELADTMKGKIEKRQFGVRIPLCLHRDALDEFAHLSGLERRSEIQKKTSEWLTAKELTQYFPYSYKVILEKLEKLADTMKGKIGKRQSGPWTPLCLHRDALDEFADLSGLKRRRDLPKKTDEWLTAEELMQYFPYKHKVILEKLEKLADTMKGKIEERQSGARTTLCLHRDALDEFARLSGLKRRGEVTPEKFHAGTKVVKAMTQMAESKKQTKDTITPDNQYE